MKIFFAIGYVIVVALVCKMLELCKLDTPKISPKKIEPYEGFYLRAVMSGGGTYVGVQECEGLPYNLVLFNSPVTGSTLALKTPGINARRVKAHIKEHNLKWGKK